MIEQIFDPAFFYQKLSKVCKSVFVSKFIVGSKTAHHRRYNDTPPNMLAPNRGSIE